MKVGILGSGLMGKEAARDLIYSAGVDEVGLADIDKDRAQAVCDRLNHHKLTAYEVDASDEKQLATYMEKFDIIIDRKSTRLNFSHVAISYAVFCLKKKIKNTNYYKL